MQPESLLPDVIAEASGKNDIPAVFIADKHGILVINDLTGDSPNITKSLFMPLDCQFRGEGAVGEPNKQSVFISI